MSDKKDVVSSVKWRMTFISNAKSIFIGNRFHTLVKGHKAIKSFKIMYRRYHTMCFILIQIISFGDCNEISSNSVQEGNSLQLLSI